MLSICVNNPMFAPTGRVNPCTSTLLRVTCQDLGLLGLGMFMYYGQLGVRVKGEPSSNNLQNGIVYVNRRAQVWDPGAELLGR